MGFFVRAGAATNERVRADEAFGQEGRVVGRGMMLYSHKIEMSVASIKLLMMSLH
jgi:hypothetical protein